MTATIDAPTETRTPDPVEVIELENLLDENLQCEVVEGSMFKPGPHPRCERPAAWVMVNGCGCRWLYCAYHREAWDRNLERQRAVTLFQVVLCPRHGPITATPVYRWVEL